MNTVDGTKLKEVIGRISAQEATCGLSQKERFIKNCLLALAEFREKLEKGIILTMVCPECQEEMHSTTRLVSKSIIDEFDINEFEGMDFECECGYKVHILAVQPQDENGHSIY